jgi:hypothetical protein
MFGDPNSMQILSFLPALSLFVGVDVDGIGSTAWYK